MFFKQIIKKEVIMNNEKKKANLSAAEKLSEALILKPDWEVRSKEATMIHEFTVSFDEQTKMLKLTVNGETYKEHSCKDILSGKIKFHAGINEMITKFNLWRYDDKN
jgi:hypothetical protein|tara:strand:+ start:349 stop:669 length:321 start_codon:yes stop_codon:yes gene_type:complete